jgi:hypothetical protein
MEEHDMTSPRPEQPVLPSDAVEKHQHEVEALEGAVYHETTQHAPKRHPQNVQAVPPTARSQQRRFPR